MAEEQAPDENLEEIEDQEATELQEGGPVDNGPPPPDECPPL